MATPTTYNICKDADGRWFWVMVSGSYTALLVNVICTASIATNNKAATICFKDDQQRSRQLLKQIHLENAVNEQFLKTQK